MAENIPSTPQGALPPKPAEAAKVQPKKETVRITLPPKPTAGPTVKIPAPAIAARPVAAPAPAPAAAAPPAPPAAPHAPAVTAPAPAPVPVVRPVAVTPGPVAVGRPVAVAAAPRAPVGQGGDTLDRALAISAAVFCVLALLRVVLLANMGN